ncbi:MAG TPA: serine/threonine protein phosphatase, partial [Terriglobia bacterium]|nr:serine/threonine protein phosphatase [Terriglobia bacterium]
MSSSASPTPGVSSQPGYGHGQRLRNFWQRVSEGRQIDELWSQFSADARASYTFYMKEADEEELGRRRGVYRFLHIAKT